MKPTILVFVAGLFSMSLSGQTINFAACAAVLQNEAGTYTFNQEGTDATGRNIYETTPHVGESCPAGSCELAILWNDAASRWEIILSTDEDFIDNPADDFDYFVLYFNNSASTPFPPSLNLGEWQENSAETSGACGGSLSPANATLTGDVQDELLSSVSITMSKAVQIVPNPNNGNFSITLPPTSRPKTLEIIDLSGKSLRKIPLDGNTALVSTNGLSKGLYLLRVHTENQLFLGKLMVH